MIGRKRKVNKNAAISTQKIVCDEKKKKKKPVKAREVSWLGEWYSYAKFTR